MGEEIFNQHCKWYEIKRDNSFHDKYDFLINGKTYDIKTAEMKKDYGKDSIIIENLFKWKNYFPVAQKPELKDYLVLIRYSLINKKYYIIGALEGKDILKYEKQKTNVPGGGNIYVIENYIVPLKDLKKNDLFYK